MLWSMHTFFIVLVNITNLIWVLILRAELHQISLKVIEIILTVF